ncbi:MAG: RluA family pseudouridine synthase [Planctomycetota bacterium]
MTASRRGWKLDLGDQRDVPPPKRAGSKPQRPGRTRRPQQGAPEWTPSADARRVGVEAGVRLSAYIARTKGGISVREAKRLVEAGAVRVNGAIVTFASRTMAIGDIVEVFIDAVPQEHHFDPRRVLFDADGVFAYDKPAKLPVTPTDATKSWSLLDILKAKLGLIIPVHRIDADTSGVVLFSRKELVARNLEEMFQQHAVSKTYMAIVRGHPREKGEHRSYLVQTGKGQGYERWESGRGADAREAITTWEVVERLGKFGSLVRVIPKTGRHHQIRIHFAEMGHPLYGDVRHGDRRDPVQASRHMLHAWKVELPHPSGGEELKITAPIPQEFERLAEALRRAKG